MGRGMRQVGGQDRRRLEVRRLVLGGAHHEVDGALGVLDPLEQQGILMLDTVVELEGAGPR